MESDETRIYNAAHLMVASLAGSLAHVTCKVCIYPFFFFGGICFSNSCYTWLYAAKYLVLTG